MEQGTGYVVHVHSDELISTSWPTVEFLVDKPDLVILYESLEGTLCYRQIDEP